MTDKFISHVGINELNNEERARIIDEGEIGYSDSEAYCRSFRSQADDAYEAYMES